MITDLCLKSGLIFDFFDHFIDGIDRRMNTFEPFDFRLDETRIANLHLRRGEKRSMVSCHEKSESGLSHRLGLILQRRDELADERRSEGRKERKSDLYLFFQDGQRLDWSIR